MEIGYGTPNGLHENFEDGKDIKMSEFEEGELVVEMISKIELGENSGVVSKIDKSQETIHIKDMSRFVVKVCKRLRLGKSFLVWQAVACLGVSAISDLVKEVEAIQACGGQKTTNGKIFWNLIKAREPNAYDEILTRGVEFEFDHYKEIMKRGKEFDFEEKQLKQTVLKVARIKQDDGSTVPFLGFELPTSSSGPQ